jgi:chemotaxis protein CheC
LALRIALDELELDAFTEMVNLGVSRAAANLSRMVGDEVILSVPSVAIVSRGQAVQMMGDREARELVAVHQDFAGDIAGRALLIFPQANSLDLVTAVTGGDLPPEDVIELEQEALAEIGNVILNGCLSAMANMLQRSLQISLPEILRGAGSDFFDISSDTLSDETVLFLYISFLIKGRDIRGYIAMIMDFPAMVSLQALICELIDRTRGEAKADAES